MYNIYMRKLYNLKLKNDFKVSENLTNFLNPDYIYLPFKTNSLIEEKKNLKIGDIVLEDNNKIYSSSISGKLKNIDKVYLNNKKINALVIENDFKENKVKKNQIEITTTNDFLKQIKDIKLRDKLNKSNVKQIIINAIEDEPYSLTERFLLKKNTDKILDTVDILNSLYNTPKNLVVLKNNELDNINNLLSKLGTYHNINLVILKDLYLIGKEKFLLEKLNLDKNNTIILNPSDILMLYNYIKFGVFSSEKYITIVNCIKKHINVINTKKYIKLADLKKYIPYNKDYLYIKNGLLSGISIDINKEIIDDSFKSIYIIKNDPIKEDECINCGKCHQVCPLNINPKLKMDTNKFSKNCIECGLCSYYCPSNINLRKYLKKEKKTNE